MINKRIFLAISVLSGLVASPSVFAMDNVTISGLVEAEYSAVTNYDNTEESGFALATVELGIDAKLNDYVDGHILALHEDGDTEPWEIDEGTITLHAKDNLYFLTAGRMYVPFGNFDSNMVSDPLTLELGETRESAVQIGVQFAGLNVSVFSFNGETIEAADAAVGNDKSDQHGYAVSYAFEKDKFSLNVSASYIKSIAESDGIFGNLIGANPEQFMDYVAGNSAFLAVSFSLVTVIAEKVTAKDEFDVSNLDWNGVGAQPETSNVEVAVTFPVVGKDVTVAVGQQKTTEALALGLPEKRSLAAVSVSLFENTSLSIERLTDTDYAITDVTTSFTGTGDKARATTVQLAVEF